MADQNKDDAPSEPDAETTKMLANMEKTIKDDMSKRHSAMGEQIQYQMNQQFDSRMKNMTDRYNQHAEGQIHCRQTDILRVNKAFREVARHLGADWKPVYRILMVELDGAELEANIGKIERQRPFMQAYKALTMWRDAQGQKAFSITPLADALRACDKYDLAEMTLDILESSGDQLYMLENVGKGIASGPGGTEAHGEVDDFRFEEAAAPSGEDQPTDSGPSQRVAAAKAAAAAKRASMMTFNQGHIEDRDLLGLSKKMVKDWPEIGKHLGVSEEDINEIKENEGTDSYQSAFKMLFTWRNAMDEINQDHLATLTQGLTLAGRRDLVEELKKKT